MSNQVTLLEKNKYSLQKIYFDVNFNLQKIYQTYSKKRIKMETQENKMGVMPVGKLLITMSLPMMISMLVQALYNIVDSIFVARV